MGFASLFTLLLTSTAQVEPLFQGALSFPLDGRPSAVTFADLNRDGRLDAAAAGDAGVETLLGGGASLLGARRAYEAGIGPIAIAAGDLDNDGSADLVAANEGSSTVSLLRNRGDGTFVDAVEFGVGLGPRALALADVNRDGRLDVVTSDLLATAVDVLLGDGHGGLTAQTPIRARDNPHSMLVADVDVDGNPDILVAHGGGVSWLRGRGDGTFANAVITPVSPDPRTLASGDVNRDGRVDLALVTDENDLRLLENAGGGAFRETTVDKLPGDGTAHRLTHVIRVLDFDGDGLDDLLATDPEASGLALRVYRSAGNGDFSGLAPISLEGPVSDFRAADVDGDEIADILTAQADFAGLALFQGIGAGRLSSRTSIPLDAKPRGLVAFDFDRDGRQDLAALSSGALHLARQAATGEFDAPGAIPFEGSVLQEIAAGDFDGDGVLEPALTDLALGSVRMVFFTQAGSVRKSVARRLHDFPAQLAAADFDGDGWSDVAVTDQLFPAVTVLLRPADEGAAVAIDLDAGVGQTALAIGDADGDGALDLALATRSGSKVFFGDGRSRFPRSLSIDALAGSPSLLIADADGDGTADLCGLSGAKIVILHAVAADGASRTQEIDVAPGPRVLDGVDADFDGELDIVSASWNAIVVARGAGGGLFGPPESYTVGYLPRSVIVRDLDGDGYFDAATADHGSSSLSILRGRAVSASRPFRRGDADGGGKVDLTDAVRILEALFLGGSSPVCPDAADANDDGRLSLTDAVSLLLYLYRGGPAPPAPGPDACGADVTSDALPGCAAGC